MLIESMQQMHFVLFLESLPAQFNFYQRIKRERIVLNVNAVKNPGL